MKIILKNGELSAISLVEQFSSSREGRVGECLTEKHFILHQEFSRENI